MPDTECVENTRGRSIQIVTTRRRSRSKPRKQKIISETGAVMPSVLLTYQQGGLFSNDCNESTQVSSVV